MDRTTNLTNTNGPHAGVAMLLGGNIQDPKKALLLFHGRGSNAENIMRLIDMFELPNDVVVCAPEAAGHQWYPHRFILPRVENEPHLTSALGVVDGLFEFCKQKYEIGPTNTVLAGFSQGACLVADYAARNPKKYAGVCVFSGGLIGTDEEVENDTWTMGLQGTPVYVGCDDRDPHIPKERVELTAKILKNIGADITSRLYSNLGHSVHPEGLQFLESRALSAK